MPDGHHLDVSENAICGNTIHELCSITNFAMQHTNLDLYYKVIHTSTGLAAEYLDEDSGYGCKGSYLRKADSLDCDKWGEFRSLAVFKIIFTLDL